MRVLHRVDETLQIVSKYISNPPVTKVDSIQALGKYSATSVYSRVVLPPKPKSTMDGYAVKSEDCVDASPTNPVILRLLEMRIRPGKHYEIVVERGYAIPIETGAFLPEGSDAVVPVEYTEVEDNRLLVYQAVGKYENVSLPGEELKKGEIILKRGDRIRPWHIAALIVNNEKEVPVYDLKASLIVTGEEFIGSSYFPPFTQHIVGGWLIENGIEIVEERLLGDSLEEIYAAILELLRGSYIVIVMGGTSIGSKDFSIKAIKRIKPDILVHGFAIRPGRTASLAIKNGRIIMGISGLPVAALSSLENILRPLLRDYVGLNIPGRTKVKARLTRRVTIKAGFKGFIRVKVYRENGEVYAEPIMVGGSGSLSSLLQGNGFLYLPEDIEGFEEGEIVEVELYGRL